MVHPIVSRISNGFLRVLRAGPSHTWLLSLFASLLVFLVALINRNFGNYFSLSYSSWTSLEYPRGSDHCTWFPVVVDVTRCLDEYFLLVIMQVIALPFVGCLLILALPAAWCGILAVQHGVPVSADRVETGGAANGPVFPTVSEEDAARESAVDVAVTVAGAGLTRFKSLVTPRSLGLTFPLAIPITFTFFSFGFLNVEMFHICGLFLYVAPFVLVVGTPITRVLRIYGILPGHQPADRRLAFGKLVTSLNERNMLVGGVLGVIGCYVAFGFLHWAYIINFTLLAIIWTGVLVGFEVVFERLGRNPKAVLVPLQLWMFFCGLLAFFIIIVVDFWAFYFVQMLVMMVLTVLPAALLVLLFYVVLRIFHLTNNNPLLTCFMVSTPTALLLTFALFISPYEHVTRQYFWVGGYYQEMYLVSELPFTYYSSLVVVVIGWMLFFLNGYREVTARVRAVYPGALKPDEVVPTPLVSKAEIDCVALGDNISEAIGKALVLSIQLIISVGRKCAPGLRIEVRRSTTRSALFATGQEDGDYFMFDRELEERPTSTSSSPLVSSKDQRARLPDSDEEDLEVMKV